MAGFILPLEDTCLKSCAQSHQLYFFPHPPYFSSLFSKYSVKRKPGHRPGTISYQKNKNKNV